MTTPFSAALTGAPSGASILMPVPREAALVRRLTVSTTLDKSPGGHGLARIDRVLVGFDGSASAQAALAVAIDEAARRSVPLSLRTALDLDPLQPQGYTRMSAPVARIVAAVGISLVIVGGGLLHSVLDSIIIFVAYHHGAPGAGLADWLPFFGWAVLGNLVGGLVLTTALRLVRSQDRLAQWRAAER